MDEKRRFSQFRQVTALLSDSNVPNLRHIDQMVKKDLALTVKTRIQNLCLWRPFLGRVGL